MYYENGCKATLTIIIMTIVFAEINVEYLCFKMVETTSNVSIHLS